MLAVAGCDRAITEPYGPFTGTWRSRATGGSFVLERVSHDGFYGPRA